MLTVVRVGGLADLIAPGEPIPSDAVWIDLHAPSVEEEHAVEAFIGLSLPTREDMVEIEPSSRLYQDDGALVMTASLLCGAGESDVAVLEPVTFVLAGERLVTIRYCDPKPFRVFANQAGHQPHLFATGVTALVNLLEAIIDRVADIIERTSAEVEEVSRRIFRPGRRGAFETLIQALGRAQNINVKARESLVSLGRVVSFCQLGSTVGADPAVRQLLASQDRDIRSLTDHASYIATNVAFLLDAALGLINIEQNQIIKVFSVATVCLMPPTLIGAIYGMNFDHMPELRVAWAYPAVLLAMLISGLTPLLLFKRKGWL